MALQKQCRKCLQYKELTAFAIQLDCKQGVRPECRDCMSLYNKEYRESRPTIKRVRNKEERKRAQAKYYAKTKLSRRQERLLAYKNWKERNPEYFKIYGQKNPGKLASYCAKRRAAKLQATPKWLTPEQLQEINNFYALAKELQWLSEDRLEVDHIVPLKGESVSGLHVPWNLQILPRAINASKNNTHESE